MNDKLSLIGAWSGHVTHYKILGLNTYHWNGWTSSRQILYTSRQMSGNCRILSVVFCPAQTTVYQAEIWQEIMHEFRGGGVAVGF